MTQHVRTSYRKHRRAAWGLAVLAATAVALVMFVAMAGAANEASTRGVTPTLVDLGGQANDCSASQVHSAAEWDFRVVNPINGTTYTDTRTGASFQITLDANQIFLGFVGTRAVSDLVVKGGQKSSWYDYDGTPSVGPVASDSRLHAPPKGNTYFPVSHVSFCYSTKGSISGTVYNDLNGNGALTTSSPAEPGLSGWTVTAYNSGGTAVATSGPTGANGSYTLSNLPLGVTYAVCAVPSSGFWALSEPTSTPSRCSSSPTRRGWQFQLDASTTRNFGAQSGVIPSCTTPFSGPAFGSAVGNVVYEAQLVPQGDTPCKDSLVVMYSYVPDTNQLYATLHPPTEGGTDPWEVVEHIRWTGITLDTQNPITLWYDDSPPYDGVGHTDLIPCNLDPRDDPNSFVLPSHADLTPGSETSCMLASTDSAGSGPDDRSYDAWIYSNVDGTRGH